MEGGQRMRVLVVDDDRLIIKSIEGSLRLHRPGWKLVTASNGIEALGLLRETAIDVLVTDLQMPGLGGMGLLASVRADPALAHIPLILMTANDDRTSMRLGMASGADDYLTKPFSIEELTQAIEARILRQEGAALLAPKAQRLREGLEQQLTARELDVLRQIGAGRATKEIAAELDLSPQTVSVHRANIMRKLDLHNAAALAALAVQAGIR